MTSYNKFILKSCINDLKNELKLLSKLIFDDDSQCKSVEVTWDEDYPIHYFAFHNDWKGFLDYYKRNNGKCSVDDLDLLGNTPLIIASKKGHKEFIDLLIFLNANVILKNNDGWSAISESISFGNSKIVEDLLTLFNIQNRIRITEEKDQKNLTNKNRDFILDFSWNVKSWIPILSILLPSDNCKLTKKGSKLRLDQTLTDFNNRKWLRGNVSCIINPDISNNPSQIFLLENNKKIYQVLNLFEDTVPKDEVVSMMTSEILDPKIDTTNVIYLPRTNFWNFGYETVTKKVGRYEAKMYDMSNVLVTLRRRREHISKKQMEINKNLKRNAQKGHFEGIKDMPVQEINDLEPPSTCITWEEYKTAMQSNISIVLGRKMVIKTTSKEIKLSIGMVEDFPLELSEILEVFDMLLPEKKVSRIREMFSVKLPPGFPITFEIPIVPTVTANILFLNGEVGYPDLDISDQLFIIPENFTLVNKI